MVRSGLAAFALAMLLPGFTGAQSRTDWCALAETERTQLVALQIGAVGSARVLKWMSEVRILPFGSVSDTARALLTERVRWLRTTSGLAIRVLPTIDFRNADQPRPDLQAEPPNVIVIMSPRAPAEGLSAHQSELEAVFGPKWRQIEPRIPAIMGLPHCRVEVASSLAWHSIATSVILINSADREVQARSCLNQGLVLAMGLQPGAPSSVSSVMATSDDAPPMYTPYDADVVRFLYHPQIRPGFTGRDVRQTAPSVWRQVRAGSTACPKG